MLFKTLNLHIEPVKMLKQRLSIIKVVLTFEVSSEICLNSFYGQQKRILLLMQRISIGNVCILCAQQQPIRMNHGHFRKSLNIINRFEIITTGCVALFTIVWIYWTARKYFCIHVSPNVISVARGNLTLSVVFMGTFPYFPRWNKQIEFAVLTVIKSQRRSGNFLKCY